MQRKNKMKSWSKNIKESKKIVKIEQIRSMYKYLDDNFEHTFH